MSDIVVVGSLNMDLVVTTSRLPEAGETVAGDRFSIIPGGKGANQALAAARLGADVTMVGRVGDDPFGATLRQELSGQGLDVRHVRVDEEAETGTALIVVEEGGENRIISVAGANGAVGTADVQAATLAIQGARALLLQFEIPLETVEEAMTVASSHGVSVILNPAPAYAVPDEFLRQVDVLVMNETECQMLGGLPVSDLPSARRAAQAVRDRGVEVAIVTLGAKGVFVAGPHLARHLPAHSVPVVDTTAAGDAFVGGLAAALAQGAAPVWAVSFANAAGALAVTRFGAQTSLPTLVEVEALLGS